MGDDVVVVIVKAVFSAGSCYCIWLDYEAFLKDAGRLMLFRSAADAQEYCAGHYGEETLVQEVHFDGLEASDCVSFLDAWNVAGDLATTMRLDFIGNHDDCTGLYAKFVYGSNIPALNTSGKEYIPVFSDAERERIELVRRDMLRIVAAAFDLGAAGIA